MQKKHIKKIITRKPFMKSFTKIWGSDTYHLATNGKQSTP